MKTSTLTRLFSTAAVIGALATPAIADEHASGASATLTLDYTTNYFFRGLEQGGGDSDQGIILQPGAEFTIPVVDDYTATIGTWNSYHTDHPTATGGNNWYETDVYASISGPVPGVDGLSGSIGVTNYEYPSLVGSGVFEISGTLSFDDSELLGEWAFNPYITIADELNNTNALGGRESTYLEFGGEFSLDQFTEATPIEGWSWTVPVVIGTSLDEYYVDETSGKNEFLGFVSVGLVGSVAMEDLIGSSEYVGAWDLTAGVTVLFQNGDIDGAGATDSLNGTNVHFIGTIGISRTY